MAAQKLHHSLILPDLLHFITPTPISQSAVAPPAVVDRQLARSIQPQFDYTDPALGLATQEAAKRIHISGSPRYNTKPSIGACIRRITVAIYLGTHIP